jgi:hypothetical protein
VTNLLRRLFSHSRPGETPRAEALVEYKGYTINPEPEKVPGGWRVAGMISKEIAGTRRVHQFGRADTSPDRDAVVALTVAKAQRVIDEQADRIFDHA